MAKKGNALTSRELRMLGDKTYIEKKALACRKIEAAFADVRDGLADAIEKNGMRFPAEVDTRTGKISRGENYRGLPFAVLDFPKHFSRDSIFALRTLFWWGSPFVVTFHISGNALDTQREAFKKNIALLKRKGFYFCTGEHEWNHAIEKGNYSVIENVPALEKKIVERKFIKIARRLPLNDHSKLERFAVESFILICSCLDVPRGPAR